MTFLKVNRVAIDLIFKNGVVLNKIFCSVQAASSISYTHMRELFLAKWRELGFDTASLGLHSLRAGGASAAANAGIEDRLFKRHGRWQSETAKDGYVKDSREARLSVSKSLKL